MPEPESPLLLLLWSSGLPPEPPPESLPLPEPPSPPLESLPELLLPVLVGLDELPREGEPLDVPPDFGDPLDDARPDEDLPLDDPLPDVLDEVALAGSGSLTGAGASVTVTACVWAGASAVVPAAVPAADPASVAGGASSLAAGSGPFAIDRSAIALAASPTPKAIATPAVAAAVVRREERRIEEEYDDGS